LYGSKSFISHQGKTKSEDVPEIGFEENTAMFLITEHNMKASSHRKLHVL
jgi:hypothetical protein